MPFSRAAVVQASPATAAVDFAITFMAKQLKTQLTGGESVFCINESQLIKAYSLWETESPEGDRVREMVSHLETDYSRNERASIAFVLIDRLLKGKDSGTA